MCSVCVVSCQWSVVYCLSLFVVCCFCVLFVNVHWLLITVCCDWLLIIDVFWVCNLCVGYAS